MQFMYSLFFLIIQSWCLYSYENSGSNHSQNTPQVEIKINNPHVQQKSCKWNFSGKVTVISDPSYKYAANYSVITHHASPELKQYFDQVVTPLMYYTTVQDHCCVLPGYIFPAGLRSCIHQLSQFSPSDTSTISGLTQRLETYCTRIENILFNRKNSSFCDTVSRQDYIGLVTIYADFLKEFYATAAPQLFLECAKGSSFMQQMMPHIDWRYYDGHNLQSSPKELQQRQAATVHGNLGATYKAFHEGNNAQAYAIGNERVSTGSGKKENITSVFEQYPALCQQVEQAYRADQARIEQARIAQQTHVQSGAKIVASHFKEGFNIASLSDRLQKRYDAAIYHVNNPEFFKKLRTLTAEQIVRIDKQHLTPDQKGILFEGGHLQHQLLDETISVVDTIISGDLVENVQDAVIGLANTSIALNKHGDVVMTTRALDTCWALIEHAQNVAQSVYAGVLNSMHPIQRGIYHGAVDSISGVVHAVLHPITTAQQAAQSVATVGYCLGKLAYASCVYDAACDMLESHPKQYEEMIAQYSIHPDVLRAVYEHAKNNASLENIARFGTKTVIDTMLLRDVTAIVSLFAKEHWAALIGCMRKGEQSAEVALTAENIPVKCGEEIACMVQKMENAAHKTGAVEKQIFSASDKIKGIEIKNPVLDNVRTGSALKKDTFHAFNDIIDNYAALAKEFELIGNDRVVRKLYQLEGYLDGKAGLFEWIVDPDPNKGVTHRVFIKGVKATGRPNAW